MGKITRGRPEKTWQRSAEKCKDVHDNSCIIARCNMSCAVFNLSMKGSIDDIKTNIRIIWLNKMDK